jgi:Predicted periplasmic protein
MRQILSPLRRGGIKAGILILAILLSVIAMAQSSKKAAKASTLEVSFNYQRQAGPGSNQYAVWIENENGEFVKTLFVTSYTAKGRARGGEQPKRGYIVRPACVPTWVKTSKAEEKTDVQLDAVTGATPQSGVQTFTWDFTDEQGKVVPQGTYKVKVEATLIFDSDIVYTGTFSTKDKPGNITLTSELTKPDEQHKDMVTDVKAVLK